MTPPWKPSRSRHRATCAVAAVAVAAVVPAAARAATFYVSKTGSDRYRGTSPAKPLRTIGKVNRLALRPGDRVLFRGGDTFTDQTLMPRTSGTRAARIVFGSYGTGHAAIVNPRGAVWIPDGRSFLTIQDLRLSTGDGSTTSIVADSATGPGSSFVTVRRCELVDTSGTAVLPKQHRDSHWRIARNTISHIGDSGLIIWSAQTVVERNRISDTGWNGAIPWAKHGIYAKGPDMTIRYNTITSFGSDGISLRYHGVRAYGNSLRGGKIGFAYFDYDPSAGTSVVRDNTASDLSVAGFYYAPDSGPDGPPRENFVIDGNRFQLTGGTGIDVAGAHDADVLLTHNVVRGSFSPALVASAGRAGHGYRERANRFYGSINVVWNGIALLPAAYRAASGQGVGSVFSPTG
jgi:hypothetical protein